MFHLNRRRHHLDGINKNTECIQEMEKTKEEMESIGRSGYKSKDLSQKLKETITLTFLFVGFLCRKFL